MVKGKSNILFFNPRSCTGCRTCEMTCSLHRTRDECNPQASFIRVSTHPYLYSSVVSVSMDCDCPDGEEKCARACNQEALLFVSRRDSPSMLKKENWLASPVFQSMNNLPER